MIQDASALRAVHVMRKYCKEHQVCKDCIYDRDLGCPFLMHIPMAWPDPEKEDKKDGNSNATETR